MKDHILMTKRFTIGIEEEFQIVHSQTGQLVSGVSPLLEKGQPLFGEHIKSEMLQATIELVSDIYPDIATARSDLHQQRAALAKLANEQGVALISAGTHPGAHWQEQKVTDKERYAQQIEEEQDAGRSLLIFGLHIHVGVDDKELAISMMNQARRWLPHLLALSSNSPFWAGRYTGLKSYRTIIWGGSPRNGLPRPMASRRDFDAYIQTLIDAGCINDVRDIWWDIRPHTLFNTVEFRICDMPATLDDTIAIAALCQALIAKLSWLYQHDSAALVLPNEYIEENKWRAIRYGLDADFIDFIHHRHLSMRDSIYELLDFVQDVANDLNSQHELDTIRRLLASPEGTGADQQIKVYQETGEVQDVIKLLMKQTMHGI
jgi:glutamate---cysteine ligase / carboxylate-amine ligase